MESITEFIDVGDYRVQSRFWDCGCCGVEDAVWVAEGVLHVYYEEGGGWWELERL